MNQNRKKVCYILPLYDPDTDTHFAYLYKLIRRTQDAIDYFLITEKTDSDPSELGTAESHTINESNYLKRLFVYLRLILDAHKKGYKDLYVHYSFIGALAAIAVTKIGGGRVFYWNCGMPWLYERSWFRERIFRFILRRVILVTGTESLAQEYVDRYGLGIENTRVFGNWIDVEEFQGEQVERETAREKLDLPADKDIVLFIHHLSKRKGADKIIPTAENMSDTLFVVLGDGPLLERLKDYNGEANLRVEGRVPHNEIHTYLSAADAFFMPSEEEGFPHVLLEAMAAGVPYVATDVGGVRDISPEIEQAFIIEKRTPENFANALREILKNPPSSQKIEEHARIYDFSRVKEEFLNLFTQ